MAVQDRGPDGGRISKDHPLEKAVVAQPRDPELEDASRAGHHLPRPVSLPAMALHGGAPGSAKAKASPAVDLSSTSSSAASSTIGDDSDAEAAAAPAEGSSRVDSVAVVPAAGSASPPDIRTEPDADAAGAREPPLDLPSPFATLAAVPVVSSGSLPSIRTGAPDGFSAVSSVASVQELPSPADEDGPAAASPAASDAEPAGPITPPHSPPRAVAMPGQDDDAIGQQASAASASASAVRFQSDTSSEAGSLGDGDSGAGSSSSCLNGSSSGGVSGSEHHVAVTASEAALLAATGLASQPDSASTAGVSPFAQVAANDTPVDQDPEDTDGSDDEAEEQAPKPKSVEQISMVIHNCRVLGPLVSHSLAAAGGAQLEDVIQELLPPDSKDDAAVRIDIPHVLLQLPLAQPPQHPAAHPVDETPHQLQDYACRAGGPWTPAPPGDDAGGPTCSAATVALYIANDSTAAALAPGGSIARRLPVLLLPSLTVQRTQSPDPAPDGDSQVKLLCKLSLNTRFTFALFSFDSAADEPGPSMGQKVLPCSAGTSMPSCHGVFLIYNVVAIAGPVTAARGDRV